MPKAFSYKALRSNLALNLNFTGFTVLCDRRLLRHPLTVEHATAYAVQRR